MNKILLFLQKKFFCEFGFHRYHTWEEIDDDTGYHEVRYCHYCSTSEHRKELYNILMNKK